MSVYVYVLQSVSTGRLYVGQTNHPIRRFHQHQSGQSRATRNRGPWQMVSCEAFLTRSEAAARERYLKSWKDPDRVLRIVGDGAS